MPFDCLEHVGRMARLKTDAEQLKELVVPLACRVFRPTGTLTPLPVPAPACARLSPAGSSI